MKSFNCPDCKLPIVTADVKAKLCKCDFKRLQLSKPVYVNQSKEVQQFIEYQAQNESEIEWAKKELIFTPIEINYKKQNNSSFIKKIVDMVRI